MSLRIIGDNPDRALLKARTLADDLAFLIANSGASPEQLAAAPILDLWRGIQIVRPALTGVVSGHPRIADGHAAVTTEIFALDLTAGWARSWSRFYRLGQPLDALGGRPQ